MTMAKPTIPAALSAIVVRRVRVRSSSGSSPAAAMSGAMRDD